MRFGTTAYIAVLWIASTIAGFGQATLVSSVVGSGGNIAVQNSTSSLVVSSTIGQAIISPMRTSEVTNRWEGFWAPVPYLYVGVNEENTVVHSGIHVYPNPMVDAAKITFDEQLDGDVTIRLVDLVGSTVKSFTKSLSLAGEQSVSMNTLDDRGAVLAAGTYMCMIDGRTIAGRPYQAAIRIQVVH